MGTGKFVWWLFVAILLSRCAADPPVQTDPMASAGVGIEVDERAIIRAFRRPPGTIYFIRLTDPAELRQERLLPANYRIGNRYYLLNVEPGFYAAVVAADTVPRSAKFLTYFAEDLIHQTSVSVGPDEFAFMGRYLVDQSGCAGADRTQAHYGRVVDAAGAANHYYNCYLGTVAAAAHDEEASREFLIEARQDLRNSTWPAVIEKQLSQ